MNVLICEDLDLPPEKRAAYLGRALADIEFDGVDLIRGHVVEKAYLRETPSDCYGVTLSPSLDKWLLERSSEAEQEFEKFKAALRKKWRLA